jgi:hypothetical protein|tara:strand:+ start:247 stop:600 length:354 start_codon:yes stop_codon:yes gene_type:complete
MPTKNTSDINILLDDLVINSSQSSSPERTLFLAVILQALLDATKPQYTGEAEQSDNDRRSAQAWFSSSVGVTAKDFSDVCDLAGVDVGYTKQFAFKVIQSGEVTFIRKRINALLTHD